jgi:cytochrome c-type biogenesis protein CcmH
MRAWCFGALMLSAALAAQAVEPRERLADPTMEARARMISAELRCMVCQNESIDESGADLAHDIRVFVRDRLSAGDSDVDAVQAIVSRYGTFILLKPPVELATYLLWYGPAVLVAVALASAVIWLRRRLPDTAAEPLTVAESRRIEGLMQGHDA